MSKSKSSGSSEKQSAVQSVTNARELEVLFHRLLAEHATLSLQIPGEEPAKLKVLQREGDFLICSTEHFEGQLRAAKLSFLVDSNPFVAHVDLEALSSTEVKLTLPSELFRVQQRQSHRLQLPEDYGAVFEVKTPIEGKFRVEDLSGEGLGLVLPLAAGTIDEGQTLEGTLRLGKTRPPLELKFLVRRKKALPEHCLLGLELHSKDHQSRLSFLHYVIDIYQELPN